MEFLGKILTFGETLIHYLVLPFTIPLIFVGFTVGRVFNAVRAGFRDGCQ